MLKFSLRQVEVAFEITRGRLFPADRAAVAASLVDSNYLVDANFVVCSPSEQREYRDYSSQLNDKIRKLTNRKSTVTISEISDSCTRPLRGTEIKFTRWYRRTQSFSSVFDVLTWSLVCFGCVYFLSLRLWDFSILFFVREL